MASRERSHSLALRLVVGGALWIALALGVGGVLLHELFRDHVERGFDARLEVLLEALVAVAEIDDEGTLSLGALPGEPRFERPYSGWYWQVRAPGAVEKRSRSLWDTALAVAPAGAGPVVHETRGPAGQTLRALSRDITLPGADRPFSFTVAADVAQLGEETRSFAVALAAALGVLGLGLITALLAQVRYGLRPLGAVRAELAEVRAGRRARLSGRFPAEVAPLAGELNAVLDHNAALVERARRHAGTLAHALKTPLTILANAAAAAEGPLAALAHEQAEAMRADIEHHLARARAAGGAGVIGARTEVAPVLEGLRRTLALLHRERALEVEVEVDGAPAFRGERQDLEEMLGNLMDNGCKWAARRVAVRARANEGTLAVSVDDDGPGLAAPRRADALARGRRLDETTPGDGLGLAIVDDLAALYGGTLALDDSPLGGLRATLTLPAAAEATARGR
jgi:signal transduction histidine kinase